MKKIKIKTFFMEDFISLIFKSNDKILHENIEYKKDNKTVINTLNNYYKLYSEIPIDIDIEIFVKIAQDLFITNKKEHPSVKQIENIKNIIKNYKLDTLQSKTFIKNIIINIDKYDVISLYNINFNDIEIDENTFKILQEFEYNKKIDLYLKSLINVILINHNEFILEFKSFLIRQVLMNLIK
jgi:hypothetical protein